jgi:hypothetical protein
LIDYFILINSCNFSCLFPKIAAINTLQALLVLVIQNTCGGDGYIIGLSVVENERFANQIITLQ